MVEASPKIFIIAGEPSGDNLGAELIASLKTQATSELTIKAVAGAKMCEQGVESIFPMSDISLMGFWEILPHLPRLIRRINQTVRFIEAFSPDVVVTVDSPGFTYHVVEKLRKRGKLTHTKFVHYVAPSVWAYKPERAMKTARLFDHLLVLFPCEPVYFTDEGLDTTFVGHMIADASPIADDDVVAFKKQHAITQGKVIISAFVGSRHGELKRLLPIYKEVFEKLEFSLDQPFKLFMPVPKHLKKELLQEVDGWSFTPVIITEEQDKKAALACSSLALVKSGTVSLEVAKAGVPMITVYKASAITAMLVRRMIEIPYVNLVNILLGKAVIDELIQEDCTADKIISALAGLLNNPDRQHEQKQQMQQAISMLKAGEGNSSDRAAEIVLKLASA